MNSNDNIFFVGDTKTCADLLMQSVSTLKTPLPDISFAKNLFYTELDNSDVVKLEAPLMEEDNNYYLPELYRTFYSMDAAARYSLLLQSVLDMHRLEVLPADYVLPKIASMFGLVYPSSANPRGFDATFAMQSLEWLCQYYGLEVTSEIPVMEAIQKKFISDLQAEGVSISYTPDATPTNPEFFSSFAFINFAYLNRGVVYFVTQDLPKAVSASGEFSYKSGVELISANLDLLDALYKADLLVDNSSNKFTDESYAKLRATIVPAVKTRMKHMSENTKACFKLSIDRVEGGVFRFKVTKRRSVVALGLKTVEQAKQASESATYTTYRFSSIPCLYTYNDLLMQKLSDGFYRVTKDTEYGLKTAIVTSNREKIIQLYNGYEDSVDKEDFFAMLEQVNPAFNMYSMRFDFYNAEASMTGKAVKGYKPHAIRRIEAVSESDIDKTSHILNSTVLRDYVISRLNSAKAEALLCMTDLYPNVNSDGTPMTKIEYRDMLKEKLTGWSPANAVVHKDSMSISDLWTIVSAKNHAPVFSSSVPLEAENFTANRLPKWKREFVPVDFDESATVLEKAQTVKNVVDQYADTCAIRFTYRKTDGTVSRVLLSKSYAPLSKVYHSDWPKVLTPGQRISYISSEFEKNQFAFSVNCDKFLFLVSRLDLKKHFISLSESSSQRVVEKVKSIIADYTANPDDYIASEDYSVLEKHLNYWYAVNRLLYTADLISSVDTLNGLLNAADYGLETGVLADTLNKQMASYAIKSKVTDASIPELIKTISVFDIEDHREQSDRVMEQRMLNDDLAAYNVTLRSLNNYTGVAKQTIKPTNILKIEISQIEETPTPLNTLLEGFVQKHYDRFVAKSVEKLAQ